MEKSNFNEIEKILREIKSEADGFQLKEDIISKTASSIRKREYRTFFYYKQVLSATVGFLLILNIVQGVMLSKSRKQIEISKIQTVPQVSVNISTPSERVASEVKTTIVKVKKSNEVIEKKVEFTQKEEKRDELIYASTKEMKDFLELYNLFATTVSPVVIEVPSGNKLKKEAVYEAI